MKQRTYTNLSQVQMRTYCSQKGGNAGRDIINAGPFANVNTGIKISWFGTLILLFAAIIGWAYCESRPEEEVCESIRTRLGIKKKINRIPINASNCVLRKGPIKQIRSLFSISKENHPIVAIIGDPASGKTELSKQYAWEYKNAYHHIWFVQVEAWKEAYRDLAKEWKLFTNEEIALMGGIEEINMDEVITKVHHSFTYLGRKKSLIIFENAPEGFIINQLKEQLPTHTDILVTSRSSDWETTLNLSSDKNCQLTLDEGIEILQKWVEDKQWSHAEAEKIVRRFEYSPVPIAQAGSYLFKTKERMKKYIPLFEQNKKEVLNEGELKGPIDIIVSLKMAMDQLNSEALKFLHYCALLPAKNIPRKLLEKLFDVNKLNKHIKTLDTLILADPSTVSIHDLFQEIIEGQILSQKKELLSNLGKVSDGFEEFLLEHPKKALHIFEQSLIDNEQIKKPNEIKVADVSHFLGIICGLLGDYQGSLEYNKKSLEIREKILGKEDLDTAKSYASVGSSLGHLRRYEEALEYAKKSLETREKILGKEHLETAKSYNNIGVSLGNLECHEEALVYMKKSLEIREKILGKEDFETAKSYHNIGLSLGCLGRHEEALEYKKKYLKIKERVLGNEHSDTAKSYDNIGSSLADFGHHEEALVYMKKSLEIREKTLGKEHPDTAKSYDNIGMSLADLGHHKEALEYMKKSLKIREKILGKEHPDTAWSYDNVGMSLADLGYYEEALEYMKKSLEIREKVLGKEHPETAESYNSVGSCLCHLGRHEEALGYFQKAFQISCNYPNEHHEAILTDFFSCLHSKNNEKQCERVRLEALSFCINKFGKEDRHSQLFQKACSE